MGERTYDTITIATVGVLTGIIITIIIVWIAYSTRSSIFYYCPKEIRGCLSKDYARNVDEALDMGYDESKLLKVDDNILYFIRPITSGGCVPQEPSVRIKYPKYCIVRKDRSESVYQREGNTDRYMDDSGDEVILGEDCLSYKYETKPLARW